MKYLVFISLMLIGYIGIAQTNPSGVPTQFSTGWFRHGWHQTDSGEIIAPRIPNFTPRFPGTTILYQNGGTDTSIHYWTGARWIKINAAGTDTTSLSNRINLKLNISDTTAKWLAQSTRLVDTMYRVNDSTVGYTIKGTAYTFQIKGGASGGGGGSGTVTSVGLSMPSAFTVTGSPVTGASTLSVSGAGTTSQYIRGNGTLATTDTGMIPNFHLKVRSLLTGTSPITFNQTTGLIGINNANTSGTKGAASFNSASFADNGSGLISLNTPVSSGSCTNCNLTLGSDGRVYLYSNGSGGSSIAVDTIRRTPGVDSIYFTINGTQYAIKDSVGAGSAFSTNNIGTGFAWVATPSGNIKRVANSNTISWDSTSAANTLTAKADTSVLATQYDLTQIGSGITTIAPIGSSPNIGGATISGSTLTLQPTNGQFGGVINTDTQTVAGSKAFVAKHNTFMGFSPRLNSQWMPTENLADSISNGRYDGFGFADMLPSGKYFMIYSDAINHVGDSAVIKIRRSNDQGRTWTDSATIVTSDSAAQYVNMGGGGVTHSGRIVVFYFQFAMPGNVTKKMNIIHSDDEGVTWSTPYNISMGIETIDVLPYGPLVKIGGDSLLLSWYGKNGASTRDVYVIKSGDDGATWGSSILAYGDDTSNRNESSFAYLGGRTVVGILRGEAVLYKQIISYDNGTTFSVVGSVTWGQQQTPPWLRTYTALDGRKSVVCYHKNGSTIRAIYAYASDLITAGVAGWDSPGQLTLATDITGNAYVNVCHPYEQPYGLGYYYIETVPLTTTKIKFLTVPKLYFNPLKQVFASPVGIGGLPDAGVDLQITTADDTYVYMIGAAGQPKVMVWGESPLGFGDFTQMIRESSGNFSINNYDNEITFNTSPTGSARPDIKIKTTGYVGIHNTLPEAYFDVKGLEAKAGAEETITVLGSNDATNRQALWVSMIGSATASDRGMILQSIEQGVAQRKLVFNPDGGNVIVGTRTDDGEKFQVNGSAAFDLGSDATGDVFYRNSGGAFTRLGIGSTGDVLTVAGGLPSWAAPAAGITTLNTLTASTQTFATGTSGTDFNISSATSTHTFNIPSASTSNRGLVTATSQTFGGTKTFNNGAVVTFPSAGSGASLVVSGDRSLASAPGISGVGLQLASFTYTNSSGAGTETQGQNLHLVDVPTLTSSNAISYTGNVSTIRFVGAPIAAGSTTLSHPYNVFANDVNYLAAIATGLNEQAGDATIGSTSFNVYTGSGGNTFTLPSLVVHPGKMYYIKNAGSGNLTVSRAGSDNLYDTSSVTTITIAAGSARVIIAGSSFWYVQ